MSFGVWRTRGAKDLSGYLKGDNKTAWWGIGISIMATQASAITFLSTPGQAYASGMGFVQFYFGLPIAMVILSVNVSTRSTTGSRSTPPTSTLENRFDLKTRTPGRAFIPGATWTRRRHHHLRSGHHPVVAAGVGT